MVRLFDKNENVVTQEKSLVKENKCSFSFTNIKPGKYAVRYFHDENLNGKMEANLVGRPREGYGFSNNVIGKFGPPTFEKWLFQIDRDIKIILKLTY